ncbi:unnamed protein product [Enterobius vermicularis]|uniref:Uncharacterized protein n=1 Tax=Enterobius vermicularis TaxID=51028 RepID=A0A0N4USX2_ENTVE|nr:unnamed protein product [Enterobius vermicularis]
MDDWEERLIDWLLDKAAWWIKVVITALCISWFACGVSIAAFGALALLTSNKGNMGWLLALLYDLEREEEDQSQEFSASRQERKLRSSLNI